MFGKRKSPEGGPNPADGLDPLTGKPIPPAPSKSTGRRSTAPKNAGDAAAAGPEPRERSVRPAKPSVRHAGLRDTLQEGVSGGRQLVVGRGIRLSGKIKACDMLIVEGRIDADLEGCKVLKIGGPGLYRGSAVVEHADIGGRFDGELTVTGDLIVRATGRVGGTLRYVDLQIERGGKIVGVVEELTQSPQESAAADPAVDDGKTARPAGRGDGRAAGTTAAVATPA